VHYAKTLHVMKSFDGDLITLSKEEFLQLITVYKQFEPVEIIEYGDPDKLTEEELRQYVRWQTLEKRFLGFGEMTAIHQKSQLCIAGTNC